MRLNSIFNSAFLSISMQVFHGEATISFVNDRSALACVNLVGTDAFRLSKRGSHKMGPRRCLLAQRHPLALESLKRPLRSSLQ